MGYLCTHFASSLNVVCMVYSVVVTRYYESLTATYSQIDISIREMRDGWLDGWFGMLVENEIEAWLWLFFCLHRFVANKVQRNVYYFLCKKYFFQPNSHGIHLCLAVVGINTIFFTICYDISSQSLEFYRSCVFLLL